MYWEFGEFIGRKDLSSDVHLIEWDSGCRIVLDRQVSHSLENTLCLSLSVVENMETLAEKGCNTTTCDPVVILYNEQSLCYLHYVCKLCPRQNQTVNIVRIEGMSLQMFICLKSYQRNIFSHHRYCERVQGEKLDTDNIIN